jgi:glutaminyl-peptide cyclotransferase
MRVMLLVAVTMGTIGFLPAQRSGKPVQTFGYEIVRSYPHDRQAFTQGLVYRDGVFYEGTGLNGRSSIRKVKVETGEVLQIQTLDERYFGEGITEWRGSLVQLTYKTEIGFVYDLASFKQVKTFPYRGEGWGLTHDDTHLIMSDGSPELRFIDPGTLKETKRLTVRQDGRPVENLNELEYVNGEIYANVWTTERIVRISPADGRVTGVVDLSGLLSASERAGTDVLNGIAYDAAGGRLFVTGKLWPRVFQIKLVPRAARPAGV